MADRDDAAIAQLFANVAANGVGSIKVSDGEIFAFSKAKVLELVEIMEEKNQDRIVVFVKNGSVPQVN